MVSDFTTVQLLIAYSMHTTELEPERRGNKARKWYPVHRVLLVMCWRVSSSELPKYHSDARSAYGLIEGINVCIHTTQQTVTL